MRGAPNQILLSPPQRLGPGSKALEARPWKQGPGSKVLEARGRGLDCIVIAKVMWQQGVGG